MHARSLCSENLSVTTPAATIQGLEGNSKVDVSG